MDLLSLALLLVATRCRVHGAVQSLASSQHARSTTGMERMVTDTPLTEIATTNQLAFSHPANCSASWDDWLSLSFAAAVGVFSTFSTTWTYYNMTAQVTTLCDGHPRIVGGSNGLTTTAKGTSSALTVQLVRPTTTFTQPTPECLPRPADRTAISKFWGVLVPNTTGTPPFLGSSSETPVFTATSGACGACSIFGGHVQLLYFPVTTQAVLCPATQLGSPTLCPLTSTLHPYSESNPFDFSPCAYATTNLTSTTNSGPFIISNGNTFYQNRAYISLHTAYAINSCGFVGSQFSETILTIASSGIYTIDGYHHQFQDAGYSVNYANFKTVPADIYYHGCNLTNSGLSVTYCTYTGDRYRYGTDFINGINTIDFGNFFQPVNTTAQWIWDEVYAPTLLVPLQMRLLDPAWSTCSLNLNGLYDPPRLLTQSLTFATPTLPGVQHTATAAPASSIRGGPAETATTSTTSTTTATAQTPTVSDTMSFLPAGGSPPRSSPPNVPGPHASSADGPELSKTSDPWQPTESNTISLPPVVSKTSIAPNAPVLSLSSTTDSTVAAVAAFTISHHVHTISILPSTIGLYEVDGEYTVTPGEPAVIIDGMPITISSLDSLVVGEKTMDLPMAPHDSKAYTMTFEQEQTMHKFTRLPGSKGLYVLDSSRTLTEGSPTAAFGGMRIYIGGYAKVIAGQQTMTLAASRAMATSRTEDETSRGPTASLMRPVGQTSSASAPSNFAGLSKGEVGRFSGIMGLSLTIVALLRWIV